MTTTQETGAGLFLCGICKAEYNRSDHLVRHVRSHTQQRPYVCPVCRKGFARQDLLKRHASTHSKEHAANANAQTSPNTLTAQQQRHSHRVQQACQSCAAKKVKCTNQKPCKRCRENGTQCIYDHIVLGSPIPDERDHPNERTIAEAEAEGQRQNQQNAMLTKLTSLDQPSALGSPFAPPQSHSTAGFTNSPATYVESADPMMPGIGMMRDILDSTMNLPELGDFIEMDMDPILGDCDFSFLDNAYLATAQPSQLCPPAAPDPRSITDVTGVVSEAYRKSRVHRGWEPGKDSIRGSEHEDLSLNLNKSPEYLDTTQSATASMKRLMSLATRDRILAMVLRTVLSQIAERSIASFPSPKLLSDLIYYALSRMTDLQPFSSVHMATMDIDEQRAELLAAFIAYGSICSPSHQLRQFGYAIQECVRTAINQLVEQQHADLRQTYVLQAFYIQLYLGYYSSISRKIEMAESNSMLGVTLLRRGKMLQIQGYFPPEHFLSLPNVPLHEQWQKWLEQETRTRLVYFAFTLDAHISASRNINPMLPYSEMETPLPVVRKLWEAESAITWRDLLMSEVSLRVRQVPSLRMILRQPSPMSAQVSLLDVTCGSMALLAGIGGMVHEYQQMSLVVRPSKSSNNFVLNSRYQDLNSMLEQVSCDIADQEKVGAGVLVLQAFIGLHLNVSFYEISKYAGIGTDEDALQAISYVQNWFDSPQSRIALWNAGQIFRTTRSLPSGSLTDVYVIALYHAAMTLWVWALLSWAQGPPISGNMAEVALDGEETGAVTRFLKASKALPGLTTSSGTFASLKELTAAPDLARDVIAANWRNEPLPLTAEEVSRLMQGISNLCKQRFGALSA